MSPQSIFILKATGAVLGSNVGSNPAALSVILGAKLGLKIGFILDAVGTVGPLADVATAKLVIKESGKPKSAPLLLDGAWDLSGEGALARYLFEVFVESPALRVFMGDFDSKVVKAQIAVTMVGEDAPELSQPFDLTIVNSYLDPADGAPDIGSLASFAWLVGSIVAGPNIILTPNYVSNKITVEAASSPYLSEVIGLTGGGPTRLDGLATVALPSRTLRQLAIYDGVNDVFSTWMLLTSNAAEDVANGVVRPDDYSEGNQKVWKQIA